MLCPKCNHELPEDSAFCNHCGENLNPEAQPIPPQEPAAMKRKPLKLLMLICGIVVFVAVAIVLLMTLIPNAQDKFFRAITNGQPEDAIAVYKENISGNSKVVAAVNATAAEMMQKIRDSFFEGKRSYEETVAELEKYADIDVKGIAEKLEALQEEVDILHTSNLAYEKAVELESGKKAAQAIAEYAKVVDDDKSYKDAQTRMNALIGEILAEAKALFDKKDFKGALKQARAAKAVIDETTAKDISKQANDLIANSKSTLLEQYKGLVVISEDPMDDRTFIEPKDGFSSYHATRAADLQFTASIIQLKSGTYFRIHVAFIKENWLFMNKVKLKSGEFTLEFDLPYNSVDRTVARGSIIHEDTRIVIETNEDFEVLAALLASKEPLQMRITGSQPGNLDFTIPNSQKEAIRLMLDYYNCLIPD